MAQRSVTREMPRLSLRASFEPSTVNTEKRTVDLVWTTGARVLRGFWEQYWEELSLDPKHVRMERLNNGAPLLNTHDRYSLGSVLGVVESAKLEAKRGIATVRFPKAEDDPAADAIFRKVVDGIIRNVSVGYQIHKMEKVESEKGKAPVYRAVDWEPHEISIVPIGADAGAGVRSDSVTTNPCVFIEERAMDPETPNPTTITITAPATTAAQVTDQQRAAQLERERVLGIQRVGRTLNRPQAEIDAAVNNPATTLDAFRAAAVEALATAAPDAGGVLAFDRTDPRIQVGADARDKYMRCAEAHILIRAGVADLVVEHAKKRGETLVLDPGECRGMTLVDLARDFLERDGVKTRGLDRLELVGRAFMHRSSGGMQATGDFPVLLENTLHKTLLASYATTPDTWRTVCKIGTVTDFRPHPRYRQGSFGPLETVNEGGEFKNAAIPDGEKQTISAGTKGRIIALTRQSIINDDMGAFNDVAVRLGRAAALTIELDFYTALLSNSGNGPTMGDGNPLFHATHGNIGTGAAISVASIDADRVLMGSQQDPAKNEYLELRPAILLLPIGLGGQARVINQAQYDVDKVANARNQEPNKVVGLYRNIVDTARLTGTTRYSFADPNIAPVFEVVFLNGQQSPFMEMQQGWRVDGTEWKIRLDFGVGATDFRGVVRNAGA